MEPGRLPKWMGEKVYIALDRPVRDLWMLRTAREDSEGSEEGGRENTNCLKEYT